MSGPHAEAPHYFFPPAAAYPLNRFLFGLKSDDAARARYQADPEAAMREAGLGAEARAALSAGDRDRLIALGAHPYLVFMAQVRLAMARDPGTFEYF
jgi:hypothetical protein